MILAPPPLVHSLSQLHAITHLLIIHTSAGLVYRKTKMTITHFLSHEKHTTHPENPHPSAVASCWGPGTPPGIKKNSFIHPFIGGSVPCWSLGVFHVFFGKKKNIHQPTPFFVVYFSSFRNSAHRSEHLHRRLQHKVVENQKLWWRPLVPWGIPSVKNPWGFLRENHPPNATWEPPKK